MRSRPARSAEGNDVPSYLVTTFVVATVLILAAISPVRCDTLFSDDGARHGRIVSFDGKGVTFVEGCGGGAGARTTWDAIDDAVFDASCDAVAARPSVAGGGVCATKAVFRFLLFPKAGGAPIPADDLVMREDGVVHYRDEAKQTMGHVAATDLRGVSYRQVCADAADAEPPSSFCSEPIQHAANFSYDTPLANKVLTRGFSFATTFLPSAGSLTEAQRDQVVSTIRAGFGSAVNSWFSGLLRRRASYDDRLRALVDGMVSRSSSGYTMLLAPQVIALRCPQAATFVVEVYGARDGPFAAAGELKAAYASRPGRTLVLNYADYPCWRQDYFRSVFDAASRCVNVNAVLTHELGHAFGLGHVKENDSIMTSVIQVAQPSDRDVDRLAAALMLSIDGAKAGEISFTTDNGVSVEAAVSP